MPAEMFSADSASGMLFVSSASSASKRSDAASAIAMGVCTWPLGSLLPFMTCETRRNGAGLLAKEIHETSARYVQYHSSLLSDCTAQAKLVGTVVSRRPDHLRILIGERSSDSY